MLVLKNHLQFNFNRFVKLCRLQLFNDFTNYRTALLVLLAIPVVIFLLTQSFGLLIGATWFGIIAFYFHYTASFFSRYKDVNNLLLPVTALEKMAMALFFTLIVLPLVLVVVLLFASLVKEIAFVIASGSDNIRSWDYENSQIWEWRYLDGTLRALMFQSTLLFAGTIFKKRALLKVFLIGIAASTILYFFSLPLLYFSNFDSFVWFDIFIVFDDSIWINQIFWAVSCVFLWFLSYVRLTEAEID
ncbi:MAG: hypothetical protein FWE37_07880 [Spirochaetaceae bacterium]|nr:hypothetical protein [Spirochaetaceae bacterium]